MMGKSIMIQGTASDAGKSLVVAGLCRIFYQDGLQVVPFKSQNMALNSFITKQGAEMGRAQVFQAEAAHQEPDVRMNPVLLKPTSDRKSQVIFNGTVLCDMDAAEYHEFKITLIPKITSVYQELCHENEVVVIEGAGSPAEINLNSRDIVNMGMAKIADAPVLLVADIDKGGVFAAIYGTIALLEPEERARVKGIIINKFRGDKALLTSGLKTIEELTGVPVVGVLPYRLFDIDEEDSLALQNKQRVVDPTKEVDIAVVCLTKISNFTDFKSLALEPDVSLRYVLPGDPLGEPDMIILPGSKNTVEDRIYLQESGLDQAILTLRKNGKTIVGICGGYQLLGKKLKDPQKVESEHGTVEGLNLLNVETTFLEKKTTTQVHAITYKENRALSGYEIHMGETTWSEEEPFARIVSENGQKSQRADGAISQDGQVLGTYLHGIFDNNKWTRHWLNQVRIRKGLAPITDLITPINEYKNREYDKLASLLRENLDMAFIYQLIR